MATEKENFANLVQYLGLGGFAAQEEEEKESFDERFSRLISASDDFAEGFAAGRLAALVDLSSECHSCPCFVPDGGCACTASEEWPALQYHERKNQPFAPRLRVSHSIYRPGYASRDLRHRAPCACA